MSFFWSKYFCWHVVPISSLEYGSLMLWSEGRLLNQYFSLTVFLDVSNRKWLNFSHSLPSIFHVILHVWMGLWATWSCGMGVGWSLRTLQPKPVWDAVHAIRSSGDIRQRKPLWALRDWQEWGKATSAQNTGFWSVVSQHKLPLANLIQHSVSLYRRKRMNFEIAIF